MGHAPCLRNGVALQSDTPFIHLRNDLPYRATGFLRPTEQNFPYESKD